MTFGGTFGAHFYCIFTGNDKFDNLNRSVTVRPLKRAYSYSRNVMRHIFRNILRIIDKIKHILYYF